MASALDQIKEVLYTAPAEHKAKAMKAIFPSFFHDFFGRFSIYLAPSGAKYCGKGLAAIGKSFGKGSGWVWKAANFGNAGFCA